VLDADLLRSTADQLMGGDNVEMTGRRLPMRYTSTQRLRTVSFVMNGREYQAIEAVDGKLIEYGSRSTRERLQG
jgi:hypothetical protein